MASRIHDYTQIVIHNVPAAQRKLGIQAPTPVAVFSGHGAPTFTPQASDAIYTDVDAPKQYYWYNGAWH